jgi:hypothetical protein
MARRMELNYNTPVRYPINALGSITYLSTLCGVLYNPTKTYKKINTLIWVFYKTPWVRSFFTLAIGRVLLMAKRIDLNYNIPFSFMVRKME